MMIATGRARCKVCEQLIAKGLESVEFYGFRASGQIHRSEKICNELLLIKKL